MMVESLNCNHCGANLEVPATTQFVTCKSCGSRLAIRRTESTTYTELLDALAPPLNAMANHIEHITDEQELARIDREWELEREQYLVSNRGGRREVPSTIGSVIGGIFIAGFGTVWTVMASSMFGGQHLGLFPIIGEILIVGGVAMGVYSYQQARAYERAYRRYKERRAAISSEGQVR